MEQLTLARRTRTVTAPLPPEAPMEMPQQSLRTYDSERRWRLQGEARVRLGRVGLVLTATLLTGYLAHQMYMVLSVGGLTSVEQVIRIRTGESGEAAV